MLISLWVKASGVEMVPLQLGIMGVTLILSTQVQKLGKEKNCFQRVAAIICYASSSFLANNIAKHTGVKMKL